ncbi:hypothetical protein NGTWS0302_38020 [Mycolicibacterium cyprinidarum]|uniref:Transposase n=1 Tax=Mycolicibacterium cyprinidarum TaxID=2860311 RepID=A0ABQ4V5J2_9MYCO|nr:hypothetical protein NGTWS1803_14100 [Mycolicibacterium sp. NGTWS1803]GJF10360.1 hypothetical protein NGTWS1702_06000 [Mycolicibacterium sp. NGTWSNA01]GJF15159.1 hypothetical protein NGTWS0302_38020 [Mycolicibacterium sp. NGTWS0302]
MRRGRCIRSPRAASNRAAATYLPDDGYRPTRIVELRAFTGETVAIDAGQVWLGVIEDRFGICSSTTPHQSIRGAVTI